MNNQNENETTEQLPPPSHETRITAFEVGFAAMQGTINEMNGKLDVLVKMQQDMLKMQQEMYVDLRGRMVALSNSVNQIQQDIQPDSFQNRLMGMGK